MSRIFDPGPGFVSGSTIDPDLFNSQNSALAETLNGKIGFHNVPSSVITAAKIGGRSYASPMSSGSWCDAWSNYQTGASMSGSILSVDLRTATAYGAWSSLGDAGLTGAQATLVTGPEDIQLIGNTIIDWERRFGYISPAFDVKEGQNNWIEFAVFIDGLLIETTGRMFPRRYTLDLPWFASLPAGSHTLDVKWRAKTTTIDASNSYYAQTFKIFTVGHCIVGRVK